VDPKSLCHETEDLALAITQHRQRILLAAAADESGDQLGVDHHLSRSDASNIDGSIASTGAG
jgi:hypothetical protein